MRYNQGTCVKGKIMNKTLTTSLALCAAAYTTWGRESNLINNAAFAREKLHWHYSGKGNFTATNRSACFDRGEIVHYLDLGNLEHADPHCAMPANRVFRFRVKARGEGKIRLTVRARLMTAGNAVEFAVRESKAFSLHKDFRDFDFELQEPDRFTVFHDRLSISTDGKVEIDSTSFYYLDRKAFNIAFSPECAVVRHGEKVTVRILTSAPEKQLCADIYCGQTLLSGYSMPERKFFTTGKDGSHTFSFTVSNAASDGMRLSISDPETGVKANFFASIVPEKQRKKYQKYGKKLSGKKHILFLGDSLTDYDRGRNYPSIAASFFPSEWSFRNAGVGGDMLSRIYARLIGEKTTRPEMYNDLFSIAPDIIFLFCGGNDTKVSFDSGYRDNCTPVEQQSELMDKIAAELRKRAPQAKLVFISPLDSFLPWQQALAEPMVARKINHNLFGHPAAIAGFTAKLREAAIRNNADFLDAGKVFRNAADPQTLNVPDDGVHLSLKGHQLMAEVILSYLAACEK